ncbi:MAG: hypothetical protein AB1295_05940 [Candidatus Micrarchaeota archaeon]
MAIKRKIVKQNRGKTAKKASKAPAKKLLKKAPKPRIAAKSSKKAVSKPEKAVEAIDKEKLARELQKTREDEQKKLMQGVIKVLGDASIRQNLIEIGGENALAIVRNFYGNCSDEELAKKLKIKISDVRATLNKLHNEGLVNYIREKDSETGWYSYSWSLNHGRMEKWASIQLNGVNPHANGIDYYFCPSCGASSVTNFESATDINFRCESCNRMLEFLDEKKMLQLYERK